MKKSIKARVTKNTAEAMFVDCLKRNKQIPEIVYERVTDSRSLHNAAKVANLESKYLTLILSELPWTI